MRSVLSRLLEAEAVSQLALAQLLVGVRGGHPRHHAVRRQSVQVGRSLCEQLVTDDDAVE